MKQKKKEKIKKIKENKQRMNGPTDTYICSY